MKQVKLMAVSSLAVLALATSAFANCEYERQDGSAHAAKPGKDIQDISGEHYVCKGDNWQKAGN